MHKVTRENDEYTCTCGLRWDIDEEDPHTLTFDPAHHDGDRSVVNGHELFKPSDFTDAEIQRENILAVAVIDQGKQVCRKRGANGSELTEKMSEVLGCS